jgi:hypothetical protein
MLSSQTDLPEPRAHLLLVVSCVLKKMPPRNGLKKRSMISSEKPSACRFFRMRHSTLLKTANKPGSIHALACWLAAMTSLHYYETDHASA